MDVDVLHGENLGVASSSRAPLDAEYGAQGGLPQHHDVLLPELAQGLGEAHRHRRLPLAGLGGGDGGYGYELPVWLVLPGLQHGRVDLCLVLAVELYVVLGEPEGGCYLGYGFELCALSYLDVGGNRHINLLMRY